MCSRSTAHGSAVRKPVSPAVTLLARTALLSRQLLRRSAQQATRQLPRPSLAAFVEHCASNARARSCARSCAPAPHVRAYWPSKRTSAAAIKLPPLMHACSFASRLLPPSPFAQSLSASHNVCRVRSRGLGRARRHNAGLCALPALRCVLRQRRHDHRGQRITVSVRAPRRIISVMPHARSLSVFAH